MNTTQFSSAEVKNGPTSPKPPTRWNVLPFLILSLLAGLVFLLMDITYTPRRPSPAPLMRTHEPMDDLDIRVELTPEQRAFLDELGPVLMAVDPDWMPYEYITEDGDFIGIAPDLLDLIARRLDITFEIIPTQDWDETLEIGRKGIPHIIPFLNQTAERDEWLLFTEPYFINPNVFVTREEHEYISDPRALQDRIIVLPHGTSIEQWVRRDFPNLEVITVDSEADTFRYVEERRADMTLRSLTMAAYVIKQEGWFNLKIAGEVPEYANHLRIGVNKNMPMLRDILNQGIATLTPAEVQEAVNRYVSIQIVQGQNMRLLMRVAAIASLIVALSLFWSHRLQKVSRALHESERSKSLLLSHLPGIAYRCSYDKNWTMLYISEGCEELTGYPSESLLYNRDLSFNDLIEPERHEDIWQAWQATIANKSSLHLEYKITTASGQEKWVYEQGSPIFRPNGEVDCIEGLIIDITDRKNLEIQILEAQREAESAVKAKSRFLAMMSHEIRTPLNGIIGISQMLRDSGIPAPQKREVDLIHSSAENLLDIINDILEFSRLEAGKVELNIQPFCVRDFFASLNQLLEPSSNAKGLELQLTVEDALPTHLQGDTKRLRQIMTNLIGNAIKFTDEGSVRIHVAPSNGSDTATGNVLIQVTDTGCGVPIDEQEHLFEEFVQANSDTYRTHGGSGLGLTITKQLVEVMGGTISFNSSPGEGSDFWVVLNLPETNDCPPLSDPLKDCSPLPNAHVLLVEDHPVNAEVAKAILQKIGLRVTVASNGLGALEKLTSLQPDIVLMDVEMPGMDGCEATRLLRNREIEAVPQRPPVPVIAMTAHDQPEIRQRCFDAGMNHVLTKPVEPENLRRVLEDVLNRSGKDVT